MDDMTVGRIGWLSQEEIGLFCSCSLLSVTVSPCSPSYRVLRHLGDTLRNKVGIWGGEALVRP